VDKISRGSSETVDYTWSGPRMIKMAYPGSYQTYLYDGYGRVTDTHAKDTSSGNSLARFTYGFDASSQIVWMDTYYYDDVQNTRITGHHLDEGDQYKYDGAKRLISVLRGVATANITNSFSSNLSGANYREFGEFAYDQTGNRITRRVGGSNDQTFQHDKANQISTEGGSAVNHDQAGNFTWASNALRYTWNNQLGVYIKAGSPATTHTWHFDALGRKVEWNDGGTREHHFYYDGQQVVELAEIVSGSEVGRKLNIWGDRIDDLVLYEYQVPNPAVAYYAHQDHLGSVSILADFDGDIAEGYRYREWGQTTIVDSSFAKVTLTEGATKNNVRYTGRDQYTVLGDDIDTWYNYRARALRTKWGRFIQRHLVFSEPDMNNYVGELAVSRNQPHAFYEAPYAHDPGRNVNLTEADEADPCEGLTGFDWCWCWYDIGRALIDSSYDHCILTQGAEAGLTSGGGTLLGGAAAMANPIVGGLVILAGAAGALVKGLEDDCEEQLDADMEFLVKWMEDCTDPLWVDPEPK